MQRVDLRLDVTKEAGLAEEAWIAATVHLPDAADLPTVPVVCFAKPGAGYSKGYFTEELPGPSGGVQAEWHTRQGWIFVSVDHLGVGESSTHHDLMSLLFTPIVAAAQAAEQEILAKLSAGTLQDGFPPIADPLRIGIGQSMGAGLTVVQQGRYHCYDGIGVLGYGAVHTHPPVRPGTAPFVLPWMPRDSTPTEPIIVNAAAMAASEIAVGSREQGQAMAWSFHYDDVDPEIIAADLGDFPARGDQLPPWASRTVPQAAALWTSTPGGVMPEAAAITSPVLVALGERDVVADPKGEPRAYLSATSVDLFICPRMGHMHNFAGTRELFWQRIQTWADWVGAQRAAR